MILRIFISIKAFAFLVAVMPVFLIVLGIEVLVYNFRYKEGKLKYDAASVILCFFFALLAILASFIPRVLQFRSDYYSYSDYWENHSYQIVQDKKLPVEEVYFNGAQYTGETLISYLLANQDNTAIFRSSVTVYLSGSYVSETEFAKACKLVMSSFDEMNAKITGYTFLGTPKSKTNQQYIVSLSGAFQKNMSVDEISKFTRLVY